jgi:hypothetical protein
LKDIDEWLGRKYGDPETTPQMKRETAEVAEKVIEAGKERRSKSWIIGLPTISNFRRINPKIADMSETYVARRSQGESIDAHHHTIAKQMLLKDVPTGQRKSKWANEIWPRMVKILQGKATPKTDAEQGAYKLLDGIRRNKDTRAKALPLKIRTLFGERYYNQAPLLGEEAVTVENYFPREYKNAKAFIAEKGKFKHFEDMYLEAVAKNINPESFKTDRVAAIKHAKELLANFRSDVKSRPYGHLEKARFLDEAALERLRKKWEREFPDKKFPLEPNESEDVWIRYFVESNDRLSWVENFGEDVVLKGAVPMPGFRVALGSDYIPEKVYKEVLKIKDGKNQKYVIDKFRDEIRNRAYIEPRAARVVGLIKRGQLTKLAFAAIPNSTQWATNTLTFIDWQKTLPETIKEVGKYYGVGGEEAKVAARETFSSSGAARYRQDFRLAAMEDPGTMSRYADILLKYRGFTGTEYWNALFAGTAGMKYAKTLAEKLQKGKGESWRSPFYKSELKRLGFSEGDIEFLIKEGTWTPELAQKVADAGFRVRAATQFLADSFYLPKSWSKPVEGWAGGPGGLIRLATQYKNFPYNQSVLIARNIRDAARFMKPFKTVDGKREFSFGREGDITKILKMIPMLMLAGTAITKVKKEVYPVFGIHFYEELLAGKSWPAKWWIHLLNAGGLGLVSDMIFAAAYGKSGLLGFVGGPTFSDTFNAIDAVYKTGEEFAESFKRRNATWVIHRGRAIAEYWAEFGARLSPELKISLSNFFAPYKNIKTLTNWNQVAGSAYEEYRMLYKTRSVAEAEEFWRAFMATQGKEYEDMTYDYLGERRTLQKPTPKQIERWWEDEGKWKYEKVKMRGRKKKSSEDWWKLEYWK